MALRLLAVSLYANAIFWSIPWVRPAANALRQGGAPRWVIGAAGVVFAVAIVAWALRRARPAAVVAASAVYGALVFYLRAIPDEVVHIAEYGGLGLVLAWAFGGKSPVAAIVTASVIGLLDEWTQGATPGRYFDWRDVVVNTIAAAVPVVILRQAQDERLRIGSPRSS